MVWGNNTNLKRQISKINKPIYRQEIHFKCNNTGKLKIKGWEMIHHRNNNQKKAGVARLIK